jgi:RNA polymerase sigma-70 factor (ECF subfamily)
MMGQPTLSELSIEELLRRAREGDERALEELFRQCQRELDGWAAQRASQERTGSPRPSDISQEAALRALKRFSTFKGGTKGEWLSWLKSIVFTQAEQLRREERRQKRDTSGILPLDADEAQAVPALQRSPSQFTSTREEWRHVLANFSQLLDDQREALQLYYLKELQVAEVARRMGRSEDSVASLLQRGLRALRDRMAGVASAEREDPPRLTAAFLDYLRRREAGESLDPEAFAAEHPDCADELRSMLHWVEQLQALRPLPSSP